MVQTTINLALAYNRLKVAFKGTKAVTVKASDTRLEITHYNTVIFSLTNEGEITLNNGGFLTKTTKHHINLCLETVGKTDRVFQKKGTWYIGGLDTTEFTENHKLTTY